MGAGTGNSTSNQQSSYSPPPWALAAGQQATQTAQGLANTPFSIPVQPIAPFNAQQNTGFGQAMGYSNEAQPFIGAGAFGNTPGGAGQYFGAEAAGVVPQLENIFGQQRSDTDAQAANAAGGFGASRIGVAEGELANQQGLAAGQTLSQLFGQSATQAQTAGTNLANIGVQGQTAGIQGAQANIAAGTQQQQQAQNVSNAGYQNILQGISWPFQTNQYLASIVGGVTPTMGGTGTQSGSVKSSNMGANLGSGSNVASGLSGLKGSLGMADGGRATEGFADGGVPQAAVQQMTSANNPFNTHMSALMNERQQLTSRLNAPKMADGGAPGETPGLSNNPAVANLLGGSNQGVPQIGAQSVIPVSPVQSQTPGWQKQMMGQKLNFTVPNNIPGQGAFDQSSPNTKPQAAPSANATTSNNPPPTPVSVDESVSPPQQFAFGGRPVHAADGAGFGIDPGLPQEDLTKDQSRLGYGALADLYTTTGESPYGVSDRNPIPEASLAAWPPADPAPNQFAFASNVGSLPPAPDESIGQRWGKIGQPLASALASPFTGQYGSMEGTGGIGGPVLPQAEQQAIANTQKFADTAGKPPQTQPATPNPMTSIPPTPAPETTGAVPTPSPVPVPRPRPNAGPTGPRTAFDMTSQLETGQVGMARQGQIAPDKGGSSSYGVLGLNSKSGSAQSFANSYPEFGLTAKPGTPEFATQWKHADQQNPTVLYEAQKEWYATHILTPVRQQLEGNNVPPSIANDPRVRAYMADRRIHVGTLGDAGLYSATEDAKTPEDFIHRAAAYDRANVDQNFRSRISENPNLRLGLYNRVDKRENMSMGITGSVDSGGGEAPRPPADIPGRRPTASATQPVSGAPVPSPGQAGSDAPPPASRDPNIFQRVLLNYAGGPGTWQRVQREEIGLNRDRAAYQSSRYQQYHDVSPQQAGPAMVSEAETHRKGMGQAQPEVDADKETAGPATSGAPATVPAATGSPQAGASQAPAGGQAEPQGQLPITRAPQTEQQVQALQAARQASALDEAQLKQARISQGPGMSQDARNNGYAQEQAIAERRLEMAKGLASVGHTDTEAAAAGMEMQTLPNGDRMILDKLTGRFTTIDPYGNVTGGTGQGQQVMPLPGMPPGTGVTANPPPSSGAAPPVKTGAEMPGEDTVSHPMFQNTPMAIPSRQEMSQRGLRMRTASPQVAENFKHEADSLIHPLNEDVAKYQTTLPMLSRLDDDLEQLHRTPGGIKSGPFVERLKDAANQWNQIADAFGLDPKNKIQSPSVASVEQMYKGLVQLGFQMSHGLTSRPAWMEVQASFKANPSAEMSYRGAHAVIRSMMTQGEYETDLRDAAMKWVENSDGSLKGFKEQADRDINPDKYAMKFAARAALDPQERPLSPQVMKVIGSAQTPEAAEEAVTKMYGTPRLGAYIWNYYHRQQP